eukprot:TRINITY_DN1870_c0_g3_i2.p1 TRINITY_DN1870_c0_g3~~TRINITY_DN1870_c0_g3_i2.p1  ORF type:complete len:242 (+),score=39.60 TRINITY_DN1870_c0_g3_i2:443-1168(+)
MKFTIFCLVVGLCALSCVRGDIGIDVSFSLTASELRCLGYDFLIAKCFAEGAPLDYCPKTVTAAWQAGYNSAGVIFEPCFASNCSSLEFQIHDFYTFLSNENVAYKHIWLSVDIKNGGWSNDTKQNDVAFKEMYSTAINTNIPVGIFTNMHSWMTLLGVNYAGGEKADLWYFDHDNEINFNDYESFAGWSKPSLKQYGTGKNCGVGPFNLDFLPNPYTTTTTGGSTHTTTDGSSTFAIPRY